MSWIANSESGASVRAKLNTLRTLPTPEINITGPFSTPAIWQYVIPQKLLIASTNGDPDLEIDPDLYWINGSISTNNGLLFENVVTFETINIGGIVGNVLISPETELDFTTITFAGFQVATGDFHVELGDVSSIDVSDLMIVGGNLQIAVDAEIDFSSLVHVGGFLTISSNSTITELAFPELKSCGQFLSINTLTSLTSLSLPKLEALAGGGLFSEGGTGALTQLSIGDTLRRVGDSVTFNSCALDQASVDNLLVRLAALDGTNGTTVYQNSNVTITGTSSPPSATGLAAKTTLEGRSCIVAVNS